MELLFVAAALMLFGGGAQALEPAPVVKDAPQINSVLLEEAYHPLGSPSRGETAWDLVEAAVYKTRKARQMFKDARAWSTGIDRPSQEWEEADRRIARVESAYKESIWPGLDALGESLFSLRAVATNVDLLLKERELFSKLTLSGGAEKNTYRFNPNREALQGLRGWREGGEAEATQAEERIEKGLQHLRKDKIARTPPYPDYLNDLIKDAEDSMDKAASMALEVAKAQVALARKEGLYWRALAALESYGGADGRGVYEEGARGKTASLSNEAKRQLAVNEYKMATRVEEVRTLAYLLRTFGKL